MILLYLFIGSALMFGAGELYGEYRRTRDRRTMWMAVAGVLIGVLNFVTAVGAVK